MHKSDLELGARACPNPACFKSYQEVALEVASDLDHRIVCNNCGMKVGWRKTREATLAEWNGLMSEEDVTFHKDRIKELESRLKALEAEREWVKCGERLPELGVLVFALRPGRSIPEVVYRDDDDIGPWWWENTVGDTESAECFEYWLTLPAKPEKQK